MAISEQSIPTVLKEFAQVLGTEVKDHRVEVPERFGKGYCTGFIFNENIRMIMMDYQLNTDIVINNPDAKFHSKMILFKFHLTPARRNFITEKSLIDSALVSITTGKMSSELVTIHTNNAVLNIEVDAEYLEKVVDLEENSPVVQGLMLNKQPLLFEEKISYLLQIIVEEVMTYPVDDSFKFYFLKIKAEELVCRVLMELKNRKERQIYPLNKNDAQAIYDVKSRIVEHLDKPPVISELACFANMSSSKLKYLFRQIFGNSIYSYYQNLRMQEAMRLLKIEKLSVAETGYRLGFTNLGHFAKVFNEHVGTKPKQYSRL
jgi:AraC-like DNA-binding protein